MQIFEFQPDDDAWSRLMQEMKEAMEDKEPVFLAVDEGTLKVSIGQNGPWSAALAEAKVHREPRPFRRRS